MNENKKINEKYNLYEYYKEAGEIHKKVMNESKNKIKKGLKILELTQFIENKIQEYGGKCAFPVNISINEQAAHFTPTNEETLVFNEDIVKIDIGVHINGCIADGAKTIDLTKKYSSLVKSSEEALKSAIDIIKTGTKISEIGSSINETVTNYGYNSIKNLMGHGLNQYAAHDDPSIPNYNNNNETKLIEGQVIAIEPFTTTGDGYVVDGKTKNIYSQIKLKPTRLSFVRNVLNQIEKYHGLPFTQRWIESDKVLLALKQLEKENIIIGYPVLVEITNEPVAQTEHTLIVRDWGAEIIT